MKVQTACDVQGHIIWIELDDDMSQENWNTTIDDISANRCPRCNGTWTKPIAPTIDARSPVS